jgi:hypothetical protein
MKLWVFFVVSFLFLVGLFTETPDSKGKGKEEKEKKKR